ncbi:MAG: glycosyltransferase family 39 protein [Defluviitaleaceae bacterium]|nr:glycosyltransferase family 39 protein [Defluviitaleaceae bacterium]
MYQYYQEMITINTLGWLFSILTSILFWGVALLVLIRIIMAALGRNSLPLSKNKWRARFASLVAQPSTASISKDGEKKDGLHVNIKIILFGVGVRIITLLLAYIFLRMEGSDSFLFAAQSDESTLYYVFRSFNRWDAPHFQVLANIGYAYTEWHHYSGDYLNLFVVFFPLYPWLIRFVNLFVGNFLASAYVVSFAAYLAGLCYIFHLVKLDFKKSTAWWAIVLISIFPSSFFFGAPHTESLFILTTAATLYYIRTQRWLLAGLAGALATATRMVGVVLIAAAAVEFVMHYNLFTYMKKGKWEQFFSLVCKKGLLILLMLVGTGVYLFINWHTTGDPLMFLHFQRINWHNGFLYFGSTMRMQFNSMPPLSMENVQGGHSLYIHLPNVLGFGFTIWMIVYAGIKRHNAGYLVYSLGYTFVSFSMIWLLSGGRYAAALVPAFIFLAEYVDAKPHRRVIVPLAFIVLLLPILRVYVLGGWVM